MPLKNREVKEINLTRVDTMIGLMDHCIDILQDAKKVLLTYAEDCGPKHLTDFDKAVKDHAAKTLEPFLTTEILQKLNGDFGPIDAGKVQRSLFKMRKFHGLVSYNHSSRRWTWVG